MKWRQFNSLILLAAYELRCSRVTWIMLATLCVALGIGSFVADLAVTESAAHRLTFYAASVRILTVAALCLLAASNVVRDSQDHVLALMLARPISRSQWLLAKAAAYVLGGWGIAIIVALPLLLLGAAPEAVIAWGLAFACELSIMIVAAIVAASGVAQVTVAFGAVMGFYLLCRSIRSLVLLTQDSMIDPRTTANQWMAWLVNALAHMIPDLARFTPGWLVYPSSQGHWMTEIPFILIQTAIAVPLLLVVGLIDFQRRDL
ncbi:MAG: hypothetical protein ACREXT_07110 [Gammaproteobacteria bacterium]